MAKRKSGRDVHGIVLLDKRLGVSSNQALQEIRRLFDANKAGHTGALDPLATGLLPLCFGEATKVSGMMLDDDKRYQVTFRLGIMTDTGDAEGQVIKEMPVPEITRETLAACLARFVGTLSQVPPMYSALKVQGRKLYELAREGKTIDRAARQIRIDQIELQSFDGIDVSLDVKCSKGTYIRSLAEDIGSALGTCATVTALRRKGAGMFAIENAHTLEQLQAMTDAERTAILIPVDAPLVNLPAIEIEREDALKIQQGQRVTVNDRYTGQVRIYCRQHFLGLGELSLNGKLAPKKLFNLDDANHNAPGSTHTSSCTL